MSRVKVKKIKSGVSDDPEVAAIFSDMMNGSISINILFEKYNDIMDAIKKYHKLLSMITTTCSSVYGDDNGVNVAINAYCRWFQIEIESNFNLENLKPYADSIQGLASVPEESKKAYLEGYKRLKEAEIVLHVTKTLVTLNDNAIKLNFMDRAEKKEPGKVDFVPKKIEQLNGKYIEEMPGEYFTPIFGLPELNIKNLYQRAIISDRQWIVVWIQKLFMFARAMNNTFVKPDVSVDDMVKIVESAIANLKKHIPRCDRAFEKLLSSINVLKDKFPNYYSDFVKTDNPSIIIENFIQDVATQSENDIEIAREFRQIINFYRKKMAENQAHNKRPPNKKVEKLFNLIETQFETLGKLSPESKFDDAAGELWGANSEASAAANPETSEFAAAAAAEALVNAESAADDVEEDATAADDDDDSNDDDSNDDTVEPGLESSNSMEEMQKQLFSMLGL